MIFRKTWNYFVKLLLWDVAEWGGNAVITDIRTQDEFDAFRAARFRTALITNIAPEGGRIPGSRLDWSDIPGDPPGQYGHVGRVPARH